MNINQAIQGLKILSSYSKRMELYPVPNSFSNGAPNSSNQVALIIEVDKDVSALDTESLLGLGWKSECEGETWVFRE